MVTPGWIVTNACAGDVFGTDWKAHCWNLRRHIDPPLLAGYEMSKVNPKFMECSNGKSFCNKDIPYNTTFIWWQNINCAKLTSSMAQLYYITFQVLYPRFTLYVLFWLGNSQFYPYPSLAIGLLQDT